jgi:hypothetical protein
MQWAKPSSRIDVADAPGKSRIEGDRLADTAEGQPDWIYDLRRGELNSDEFYQQVAVVVDQLLVEAEFRAGPILDEFSDYLLTSTGQQLRSRGEYALELLTLGMAVKLYASAAAHTPNSVVAVARQLLRLRHRSRAVKPVADFLRACLFSFGFANPTDRWLETLTRDRLPRLLRWMEATGELAQETARLQNWRRHLLAISPQASSVCLRTAVYLFDWFAVEAANALGTYTKGVRRFLGTEFVRRGIREDRFFCSRIPAEYHLGMVAAEIMNRVLRAGFDAAPRKVVLLPTCMRGNRAATCKARTVGDDITCSGCDPNCAVGRVTRQMRTRGIPVYLVPHASSFSRSLERWQRETDTGVVAVACALNILPGGYEMRARAIPSQCVLLDYPGCERHWCRDRLPTSVNEERLVRIAASAASN